MRIVSFSVTNFKSISEEQFLSFESPSRIYDSSQFRPKEVQISPLEKEKFIRLYPMVGIFGASMSGKSNILEALHQLFQMSFISFPREEEKLPYKPFHAPNKDENSLDYTKLPTTFGLNFIGANSILFEYKIVFNFNEILEESLDCYPNGRKKNFMNRIKSIDGYDIVDIKKEFRKSRLSYKLNLLNKIPLLRFCVSSPILKPEYEKMLLDFGAAIFIDCQFIYHNLNTFYPEPTLKSPNYLDLVKNIIDECITIDPLIIKKNPEEQLMWFKPLIGLLNIFGFNVTKLEVVIFNGIREFFVTFDDWNIQKMDYIKSNEFQILFRICFELQRILKFGGLMVIDDLNIHLSNEKQLLRIFDDEILNPHGAQLIFVSNNQGLMESPFPYGLPYSQTIFCEKTKGCNSEYFSVADFDGVEVAKIKSVSSWYIAGKFGALPNNQELFTIYNQI